MVFKLKNECKAYSGRDSNVEGDFKGDCNQQNSMKNTSTT